MESIEQPIFNPYASDDKDELIDTPSHARNLSSANSNSNNGTDSSPVQAAKGLLSSGKEAMADHSRGLWIIIISTIVFAVIITIALILTIYLVPKQVNGHAAVVTEVSECSDIGLDMLRKGGSAVDAAVAAAFCLSVYHPHSSGIGGGGFLLYHDHKNDKSIAYDFREMAPAAATPDMLSGLPNVDISGKSVAVPGELKGLSEVHKEWGVLEWATVIQPSINLAHQGFNVTENLAESLAKHVDMSKLPGDVMNGMLKIFVKDGQFVKYQDFITRPDLAQTLEMIRDQGANAFYSGPLGKRFVAEVNENGGILTESDLQKYTVLKKKPIISTFKGRKVVGIPAPSSGPVVALMLKMMDGFNWTAGNQSSPATYQQMIETFKFGFAHRSLLGDPANPIYTQAINNDTNILLSDSYAAKLRDKVDNNSHDPSYYGPTAADVTNMGTTHVSVIDSGEVMVSMTLTNNYWFGSKLMTEDGIIANNEMLDFSSPVEQNGMPPNERNLIVPGMRPLSSMVPTIVFSKEHPCAKRVIIGASNNTRIITGVIQTLINIFAFDMDLQKAVAYPRLHQQLYPNANTLYEVVKSPFAPGGKVEFPKNIVDALTAQTLVPVDQGLSCVYALMKINDDVEGQADWRKGGHVAAF